MGKIGHALDAKPGKPRCDECPLFEYTERGYRRKYYVEGDIIPYAPLLFVGMAPGKEEVKNERVFTGSAGRILDIGLEDVGLERDREVSCINLLGCKVPDSPGKPNDWSLAGVKAIKACAPRFVRDLRRAAPELLVTLGKEPLKAIDPSSGTTKISKLRGYFREAACPESFGLWGQGLKILPTWHPAYLLYEQGAGVRAQFLRDLRSAREVCRYGSEKAIRKASGRRRRPLPSNGQEVEPGRREVPAKAVDWSLGSLRPSLPAAILDTEVDVVETDAPAPRLLCIGVSPYPRTRAGQTAADGGRQGVRVVPVEKLPRRLAKLRRLCGHNTPFDYCALRRNGILTEQQVIHLDDTMVMASLFDENREAGLKTYAEEFGYADYWTHVDRYWKGTPKQNPPLADLHPYNASDVSLTRDLYVHFRGLLDSDEDLGFYYDHFLTRAIRLAAELELNGIEIETSLLKEVPRVKSRLRYRAGKLFDIAGVPREERSLKLLRKKSWMRAFLFGGGALQDSPVSDHPERMRGLNLPVEKRFRTAVKKEPQLTRDHFEYLIDQDSSGALQILYELSFIQKQLVDLQKLLPYAGGMVYPSYNIGGTGERDEENKPVRTGRWSARDPNVQQFAPYLKRHVGSRYRDGWLLQWDGDQIETRVAACYSGDPRLLSIFREGLDPYVDCAAALFGRDKAQARRFMGKRSLLAAIYGVGAVKLRRSLNKDLANRRFPERVTTDECREFLERLRARYSTHYEWIRDTEATVRRTGVVESLSGRKRHLPPGRGADRHTINQAINFPIQNLANDLNLLSALQFGWRFAGGVLTTLVHDSGVADCRDLDAVGRATAKIRRVWETLPTEEYFGFVPRVPLTITVSAGRRWHPMTEFTGVNELEGRKK